MASNNIQNQNTSVSYQPVSYVSSTPPNLKFKNSPFYMVLDEIIKPTVLTTSGEPLKLSLTREHIEICFRLRRHEVSEFTFQFQIRIGKREGDGSSLIVDYLPAGLQIIYVSLLNPSICYCEFPQAFRATKPINCNSFLTREGMEKSLIFTKWIPDENNYFLILNLVRKLTVSSLIEQLKIKGDKSSNKNLEKTKTYILNMIADDDLVLATGKSANCFGLICPLSKKRMEIPVKSIHCDHLQCFDAKTFLLMNEQTPRWKCPICDISCLYNDLEIQYYFFEVLSSSTLSDDCKYIEFESDGTWIAYEKNEMAEDPINLDEDERIINELE